MQAEFDAIKAKAIANRRRRRPCAAGSHTRLPRAPRGVATQAPVLADRPEPALAARRHDDERRRVASAGTRGRHPRPCSTASSRPGTTATSRAGGHVRSPLVFAHIHASTGTAVQQTNCHPFRHGRWLWMHNGAIRDSPGEARPPPRRRHRAVCGDRRARPTPRCSSTSRSPSASRTTRRRRSRRRSASSRRPGAPRRRASDPDDGGDDGRGEDLGVPLLQRGHVALALLQHRSPRRSRTLYRTTSAPRSRRRVAARRLGAARRPRRRLERGAQSHWAVVQPGQDEPRVHAEGGGRGRFRRDEGRARGSSPPLAVAAGCGGDDEGGESSRRPEWAGGVLFFVSTTWSESVTSTAAALSGCALTVDEL